MDNSTTALTTTTTAKVAPIIMITSSHLYLTLEFLINHLDSFLFHCTLRNTNTSKSLNILAYLWEQTCCPSNKIVTINKASQKHRTNPSNHFSSYHFNNNKSIYSRTNKFGFTILKSLTISFDRFNLCLCKSSRPMRLHSTSLFNRELPCCFIAWSILDWLTYCNLFIRLHFYITLSLVSNN